MFERDKAELRDLGIPLETGRNSALRHRGRLPDHPRATTSCRRSSSTPAEAAAVGLAARLWQSATLGEPARSALIKLRAAGTDVQASGSPGAVPHVDASDPSLPALLDAAPDRPSGAVRLPQVRRAERRSGAPSSRGACCPGGGAGTWPGWTATAVSRAASGCPASSAGSS